MVDKNKQKRKPGFKFDWAPSFAGEDREFARKLVEGVKAKSKSANIFFDEDQLADLLGESSQKFRDVYSSQSKFVSPIISKNYIANDYARHEFEAARNAEKQRGETTILPIRLDDSQLFGLTDDRIYLDIHQHSIDKMVAAIAERIQSSVNSQESTDKSKGNVEILDATARTAFGIIAFLRFPLALQQYEQLFPDYAWRKIIKSLEKSQLVRFENDVVAAATKPAGIVLKDEDDRKRFKKICLNELERLHHYIDIAPILATIYTKDGNFNKAAQVLAKVANEVSVGNWNDLYISSLTLLSDSRITRKIEPQIRLETLHALSKCLNHGGQYGEAKRWLAKARKLAYRVDCDDSLGHLYQTSGVVCFDSGEPKDALNWFQQALDYGNGINNWLMVGRAHGSMAELKRHQSPHIAKQLLEQSIKAKKKAKDEYSLAIATFQLGNIEAANDRPDLAIPFYEQALEQLGPFDGADISMLLHNLATANFDCGRNSKAMKYFRRCSKIAEEFNNIEYVKFGEIGVAQAAFELAKYDEVESAFQRLLEFSSDPGDKLNQICAHHGIGIAKLFRDDSSGHDDLKTAMRLARKIGDLDWIARCVLDMHRDIGSSKLWIA